jgi:hypothetical protein
VQPIEVAHFGNEEELAKNCTADFEGKIRGVILVGRYRLSNFLLAFLTMPLSLIGFSMNFPPPFPFFPFSEVLSWLGACENYIDFLEVWGFDKEIQESVISIILTFCYCVLTYSARWGQNSSSYQEISIGEVFYVSFEPVDRDTCG